jgi:hypothetical protein
MEQDAPAWRRARRHAVTLLLVGLYAALVGPSVATVLMAVRANGLAWELFYSITLMPWAVLVLGPGVFALGLVFGWMLIGLAGMGINHLAARMGLAVLVATIAWWLVEPLSADGAGGLPADWAVWAVSAAVASLIFTRGWVAHRITHPVRED